MILRINHPGFFQRFQDKAWSRIKFPRMPAYRCNILFGLLLAALVCAGVANAAGLNWSTNRFLPAFPTPATNIDCIDISSSSGVQQDLFASLEGIVNRTQPRIACISHRSGEDQRAWLKIHQLTYQVENGFKVAAKYKGEITGLVVTDPDQPDTLNLATTLAGLNDELICAPELLAELTNAPCSFPIKDDLRGRFADKFAVYEFLRTNCWPRCTHRVLAGLSGGLHGSLRDYLVAVKSAVVWFNPSSGADAAALKGFVSEMQPANSVYLGWWPDEAAGLEFVGKFGIPT